MMFDLIMHSLNLPITPNFETKAKSNLSIIICEHLIKSSNEFDSKPYSPLNFKLPLVKIPLNLKQKQEALNRSFPWISAITDKLFLQLEARSQSNFNSFKFRPLLIVGGPGVGKSTYAKAIAGAFECPFNMVMASGSTDSMTLKGAARGWSTTRPGLILQTILATEIANPLIIVDELDKAGGGEKNGRMTDVLLQLIEPASSKNFYDECLQVSCDLSNVNYIATANSLSNLSKPLLDRFTIVYAPAPAENHVYVIAESARKSYADELQTDERFLPSIADIGIEFDVLKRLTPRQINRYVVSELELMMARSYKMKMRN